MKRLRPSATSLRRAATRVSSAGHSFGPTSLNRRDFALLLGSLPLPAPFPRPQEGCLSSYCAIKPTRYSASTETRRAFNMARRCSDLQEFWQVKSFNSTNE